MQLKKVVIGVSFTRKSFKLASLGGIVIDEILALRETNRKLDDEFLTRFSSANDTNNLHVKFVDDRGVNALTIQPDSFTFTKASVNDKAVVNVAKVIEEFEILWKTASKILNFKDIRRIGLVGEFHIDADDEHSSSNQLLKALTKCELPGHSGRFQLQYEDRELHRDGSIPDASTADYWNTIYTYSPSEASIDSEIKGKMFASLDVQKYYNPAKAEPVKELRLIKSKFDSKKSDFKKKNKALGLVN